MLWGIRDLPATNNAIRPEEQLNEPEPQPNETERKQAIVDQIAVQAVAEANKEKV
jgi:hypothetical protein